MTERADYIARIVAEAPPLTEEQKDRLFLLIHGKGDAPLITRRRVPAAPKPTKIYRHYDSCGCLLYIGISHDPIQRAYAHGGTSWWTRWAVRMDTDEIVYGDRRESLAAERDLIQREGPVFNSVHASDRNGAIIRYLMAHERWEHLAVPALVDPAELPDLLRALARANLLDGVTWTKDPRP